jgi:TPR repeat protein
MANFVAGRQAQAAPDFSKAIELEPANPHAWNGRGWAYMRAGKLKEAKADFDRLVELDAKDALAWKDLGVWHWAAGHDRAQALLCFEKSFSLGFSDFDSLLSDAPEKDGSLLTGLKDSPDFKSLIEKFSPEHKREALLQAAQKGDAESQFKLGVAYERTEGGGKDTKEALVWYRKAAEQGHAKAQVNLGLMYYAGDGTAKDIQEAVKWFRKAAELGDVQAAHNLGWIYYQGQDSAKSPEEAAKWFLKAAESGDVEAQYNIAAMYYHGEGVAKNAAEAYIWSSIAASQGLAQAVSLRDDLEKVLPAAEGGAALRAMRARQAEIAKRLKDQEVPHR